MRKLALGGYVEWVVNGDKCPLYSLRALLCQYIYENGLMMTC